MSPVVAALAAITIAGAVLRFATLGHQSYYLDEAFTVVTLRNSFGAMLSAVHAHESTPPLYYVLAWFWRRAFGDSEVALRSLSALIGTLTIPVAYEAARELAGRRTAVVVAALAAFSPPLVWYSQEARAYALLALLSAGSLLFFARARRTGRRLDFAAWAVVASLALATHYFALFIVVPEAAVLLGSRPTRRRALLACAGVAAVAAALAPLALHQSAGGQLHWISSKPLTDRLAHVPYLFAHGAPGGAGLAPVLAATAVVGALALLALLRRAPSRARSGGLLALGIGIAALVLPLAAVALGKDYLIDRNMLAAWVPLAIFVAAGIAAMPRLAGGVLLAAICATSLVVDFNVNSTSARQRDDWRDVAARLGPTQHGRAVIVQPRFNSVPIRFYEPRLTPMKAPRAVAEIDTVVRAPADARGKPPVAPVPGPPFVLVSTTDVQRITIRRFVATEPVTVVPLASSPARSTGPFELYEAPR